MQHSSNEKSLVQPGHFGKSVNNIKILNNFIELDDLKTIQNFLPNISEWEDAGEDQFDENGVCTYNASYWSNRQCGWMILKKISPEVYFLVEKYIIKMKKYLESEFRVQLSHRPPIIVRWFPGLEQQPHADKQLNDGSPNPFPTYDINSLFYYNDEFEGGELYYPDYEFEIKPSPGLAVAHPGDIFYLHGVKMVTSGERFTTPSFYTIEKIY